ncbi:putative SAM-dependent methyltransferase [Metamycoplasma cloacale]|uniref:Ribosomal RNA small subunit methyltransferase I n=1 Tax=Metamycoplasma cloacale TaxID=92401 RepID=A0A2Z4LMA6_9BACT|nr:16S rRNA (cytidine(1402)-2'-O)-methyltransferase [Metamycoplasma cloacale]AWX42912.1 16S rRNA (cytidine(1402)-2'-O)-methyltransferase [Metamycoplasma cloacale]VEU79264.1 putative SAM-dependent methyltransferase [Metamycoplasma cloacale]
MEYKLNIVGTPIGNLDDITIRALNTLKSSDVILCEDIRVGQKLLKHYEITGKTLISYHNFNEHQITPKIIHLIQQGKNVSLITDAGMPCISDPGFEIIKVAKQNNIFIDVIGGPTALIHALIKANFSNTFTFLGFLKDKSISRQNQLKELNPGTYVCYVSPHKLHSTIQDFEIIFNDNIQLYLIKEMTKLHEFSYEGTPKEILQLISDNEKGEFSLVFDIKPIKKTKINKYAKEII